MRPLIKRGPLLKAGISGLLVALAFVLLTSASSNAGRCPPADPEGKDDTGLYCLENFDLLGNRSNIGTDNNSTSAYMASANYSVNSPNQPVAGLLVYGDYVSLELRARDLLSNTLEFRKDISPYQGKKNFDDLVRQFDQASDFATTYYPPGQTSTTMLDRINKADADLREARNLYAFLAVYAPRDVMRQNDPYVSLCAEADNFLPPSKTDPTPGAVGPPIRDWCNFEARMSETVREAGNIRMIFGQQFMVAALGVGFSGTLYGGDAFVKEEIGKLRAAQEQFRQAEAMLTEGFRIPIGNGCMVSDFYGQQEWSLLSRASDSQIDAQREIGVRMSYLGLSSANEVPAAKARSADALRDGYMQGYAKLVRMSGLASNNLQKCGQGVRPDAQLATDMAASMLEARNASLDVTSGRNVFGLDTTWTPTLSYASLAAAAEQRRLDAQTAENIAKNDSRYFDDQQAGLMSATTNLLVSLDMEVSNQLGCSNQGNPPPTDDEFYGCARDQQTYLTQCAEYVAYEIAPPRNPLPGITTFDQCMNRKDGQGQPLIPPADGKQALYDLRSEFVNLRSIQQRAANIRERISISEGRNATVTAWLLARGVAQTAADVAEQMYSTIVDSTGIDHVTTADFVGAVGLGVTAVKAAAGAISTAADVEIENADLNKEVKNMLIDMSEMLIDAEVSRSAAEAKRVAFVGILGHMDDVMALSKRQKAYLKNLPGNDPSYRIIRDSSRIDAADKIRKAALTAYLAARRAEYEYAARLSASGFSISKIYRARSSADITTYMSELNNIVLSLSSSAKSDVYTLPPISVAQHVLGWTDAALAQEGFTTPAAAEAERVRRFRAWVAQNTKVVNGEQQLSFSFGTTLLNGGLFANLYGNGYDQFWLHKITGVGNLPGTGQPVHGLGVNLVTQQTGLSKAKVSVTQGGMEHLKNMDGCTFDFKLVEPAYMLSYEWATTQKPDLKSASFDADVNGANANVDTNFRTSVFEGRPVSATSWQVLLLSSVAGSAAKVDFQQMKDIQLLLSTTHASRQAGPVPPASACARIDW